MKKIILFVNLILSLNITFAQTGNSPYPIIFIHGLNSDDQTWNNTLNQLSSVWNISTSHVLHFVLNSRGGDTTDYSHDVIFPLTDANGNNVNILTRSDIYSINFGNFWNRNNSGPGLILYNNSTPGSNQSPSNQSAIIKQGYALKILIDSVLRVTNSDKVILVGHSMGGLAIREYLQRRENDIPKWWVNPSDTVNGHKVAKVVTTGTPHSGTNVTSIPLFTIDNNSEAMRDMRYTYSNGYTAAYLFSNIETTVPSNYYNKDINCNGSQADSITGISINNTYNSLLPLPMNILYTWITSNYLGLGSDLAVPTNRQWLNISGVSAPAGISDTLFNKKNHLQQTGDYVSLIRGLDEPDKKEYPYIVYPDKLYSGFITLQSNGFTNDTDFYKVQSVSSGKITIIINSLNSGVANISIISIAGNLLSTKNISGPEDSVYFTGSQNEYLIRITGNSNLNPGQVSYRYKIKLLPALKLNLTLGIEGLWDGINHVNDTVRVFLRNNNSPYGKADSALVYLNNAGNSLSEFLYAEAGNYFIEVNHRNGLETWSYSAESFSNLLTSFYDFTASQSMAYGSNQIFKSGKWCIYSGDVNSDGTIDGTDLSLIDNDAALFSTGYINTDLNGDLITDGSDLLTAGNNAANFIVKITP